MAVQLARRGARKPNTEDDFMVEEFELCARDMGVHASVACGRRDVLLTPDHIVSLALGESSVIPNVQSLRGPCNSRKNAKAVDYRPGGATL